MKPFLVLKSLVAGYTRRDGVFVKPHADKRSKRAAAGADQLVLFPAPAKKPIPPNPFKGLDPVKSTPDLFEETQLTVNEKKPIADSPAAHPPKSPA